MAGIFSNNHAKKTVKMMKIDKVCKGLACLAADLKEYHAQKCKSGAFQYDADLERDMAYVEDCLKMLQGCKQILEVVLYDRKDEKQKETMLSISETYADLQGGVETVLKKNTVPSDLQENAARMKVLVDQLSRC